MPLERLTDDDARILALESARVAGHTCKVLVLEPGPEGPIDLGQLRRHVEARLWRAPRARRLVARTPLGLAPPVWIDDPDFDVEAQITGSELPAGGSLEGVAAELMAQRLDHSRPLWHMDLVGPLEDGSFAVIWRIHHAMAR